MSIAIAMPPNFPTKVRTIKPYFSQADNRLAAQRSFCGNLASWNRFCRDRYQLS